MAKPRKIRSISERINDLQNEIGTLAERGGNSEARKTIFYRLMTNTIQKVKFIAENGCLKPRGGEELIPINGEAQYHVKEALKHLEKARLSQFNLDAANATLDLHKKLSTAD